MSCILEITVIEAIKARAQLRARNWVIKKESNGNTYIVHRPKTKPVADGLVDKAIRDLDAYHYKKALKMRSDDQKSKKDQISQKVEEFIRSRLEDPNLSQKAKDVYIKAKNDNKP